MNHFPISVNYGIDVSSDQLKRILAIEENENALQGDMLYCRLYAIPGVLDVEYTGLSATIFLTVESTFDHQLTWEKIYQVIEDIGGK